MSEERKSLNVNDPWWGEHIHRYKIILPFIRKTDVILDLACGSGYGTNMLAGQTEQTVIGGDISEEAIDKCNATWKKSNLFFKKSDGTRLEFDDNYFDKIVSFETIEHTTEYKKMLLEFKRILKPGGRLFLSTPNRQITSPDGIIKNPYHTQEFSFDQLKEMVQIFSMAEVRGQQFIKFDKKGFKNRKNKMVINFLLMRGVRKIPFSLRQRMVKALTGLALYPADSDFILTGNENDIKNKCPVLFAICKK
jgi:2-polyprenyl-3-methyl-5-hydroxy-6-metoxy-1,4-benzoquinol methylase